MYQKQRRHRQIVVVPFEAKAVYASELRVRQKLLMQEVVRSKLRRILICPIGDVPRTWWGELNSNVPNDTPVEQHSRQAKKGLCHHRPPVALLALRDLPAFPIGEGSKSTPSIGTHNS